ncbi:MAG TPA: hypothetical protein VFL90_19775 [Methylomirabilota bacterium]|nr:hypothetical protein [Methylomirabilota bacterium]
MEYVIVDFPGRREVLVDGVSQGHNQEVDGRARILRVEEGLHRFRLRGPDDYIPLWQTVDVEDTNVNAPLHVVFTRKV